MHSITHTQHTLTRSRSVFVVTVIVVVDKLNAESESNRFYLGLGTIHFSILFFNFFTRLF